MQNFLKLNMVVGKPYIVTKESDDGTFQVGDHISFYLDGSIVCKEACGWIDKNEVFEATKGMEIELDEEKLNILEKN